MSIRLRFILIIASVLVVSSLATWFATEHLIKSQYIKIENENVEKDTNRAVNAINDRIDQLAHKIPDWSSWDDTYAYIDDQNEEYVESNLQPESLQSLSINFMLFFNEEGKIVFSTGVDDEGNGNMPIPEELLNAFSGDSGLLTKKEEDQSKGILRTSNGPLVLATSPIIKSDRTGPVRGTLVFAKYLTQEDIKEFGELTRLNLSSEPAIDSQGAITEKASTYSSEKPSIEILGSNSIAGHQIFNDIYGEPIIVVSVNSERAILQETQKTLIFYLLVVIGVSLASIIIVIFITDRIVKQTKTIELERASKKEIERQVVDRTREAQEGQARLRSAMDGLQAGILITFNDREQASYNPALVNILGLRDLLSESKQTGTEVSLAKIIDKVSANLDFDIKKKIDTCQNEGKIFELNEVQYGNKTLTMFGAPVILSLDKIIGTVILVEDITESKIIERSKDEFFSIASHELRTPLTAIKGNSGMIIDYFKEALKDEQVAEMMHDIHGSSIRLIEIVSDFLDVSRLEQGKMQFDLVPVDVLDVIKPVAIEIKTTLNKDVELVIDEKNMKQLPKVNTDKNKLTQVVYNLIGNSAKFTEKGKIEITAREVNKHVEVSISDTGRGIAPEMQKLLFRKFQQANESLLTRDTTKGTGLGLYISKMLIEKMDGSIKIVKTEVDKGTTFAFTLPIARSENPKSKV